MFCKNCGEKISDNLHYCPHCGSKSEKAVLKTRQKKQMPETKIIRKKRMVLFSIAMLSIFLVTVIWLKKVSSTDSSNKTEGIELTTAAMVSESNASTEETKVSSIIGVWKCAQGEVAFTEKGHMMLAKNGVVLGGGWLKYEVVDNSTIYLSGGDVPVGINMKYEMDGDYLGLELNGETIVFYKEQ